MADMSPGRVDAGQNDGDGDELEPGIPFLLTRFGSFLTFLAVAFLYLTILAAPAFGARFALAGANCAPDAGLVCSGGGRAVAMFAPSVALTIGLLVTSVGCYAPPLRHRRPLWIAVGYTVAFLGMVVGFAMSRTAP